AGRSSSRCRPRRPSKPSFAVAADVSLQSNQGEKLHASCRVGKEDAVELARRGPRPGLLHPTITHAKVLALHDHCHALRLQMRLDGVGDLLRELLLHLKALGEHVDHPGELAESDDAPVRDVADVSLPDEGDHVMLAVAVHLDIADEYELVVSVDLRECLGK